MDTRDNLPLMYSSIRLLPALSKVFRGAFVAGRVFFLFVEPCRPLPRPVWSCLVHLSGEEAYIIARAIFGGWR